MKDSRSEHKQQSLNARLLRFRSQPDSEDAYTLAEELIAAQRYADARSVASSAQPKDAEDGGLLLLEGRAHLLERDLVRAQAVLLRAVRVAPDLQPAYRFLGEVLLKRGDPERAARTLHRALSLDPEDAEAAKLAARAEYLAEAANDGLEALPSQKDSAFDSEPAARRSGPPASGAAADSGGPARRNSDRDPGGSSGRSPSPPRAASSRAPEREPEAAYGRSASSGGESSRSAGAMPAASGRSAASSSAASSGSGPGLPAAPGRAADSAWGRSGAGMPAAPTAAAASESATRGGAGLPAAVGRTAASESASSRGLGLPAAPGRMAAPESAANRGAAPLPAAPGRTAASESTASRGVAPLPAAPVRGAAPPAAAGRSGGAVPAPLSRATAAGAPPAAASGRSAASLPAHARRELGVDHAAEPPSAGAPRSSQPARGGVHGASSGAAGIPQRDFQPPSAAATERGHAGDSVRGTFDAPGEPSAHGSSGTRPERGGSVRGAFEARADTAAGSARAAAPYFANASDQTRPARARKPEEPTSERRPLGGPPLEAAELDAALELAAPAVSSPAGDRSRDARDPHGPRNVPAPGSARARQMADDAAAPAARNARSSDAARVSSSTPSRQDAPPRNSRDELDPRGPSSSRTRPGAEAAPESAGPGGRSSHEPPAARRSPAQPSAASARTPDARALGQRLSDLRGLQRGDPSSTAIEISASVATIESDPPPPTARGLTEPLPPASASQHYASEVGTPVDAEQVLQLVHSLGLFEEPSAQRATWAERSDIAPSGQRMRNALIGLWLVTLLLCGGGYYGWRVFVERRHARAAAWVAEARSLMLRGDHGALVDAERMLRLAREQHPASETIPSEALVLQTQRVLEDGERDMAALQSAYARARSAPAVPWAPVLTQALLAAASGDGVGRDKALADVLAKAPGDPRALYLVGRAEQRAGRADAEKHLQAALQTEPKLLPAQLALAELAYDRGEREAAKQALAAARKLDGEQLRVHLFALFVAADDADPKALARELAGLGDAMKKAGHVDRALEALTRARLARREAQSDAAAKAVEAAASSGTGDARVLAWIAREALAVGKLPLAQHMASQALSAAPDVAHNRRLLARILIERNDGEHAFTLLTKLPADDLDAGVMKAQAALLSSDPDSLRSALSGLSEVSGKTDAATRVAALRLRIEAKLEPTKAVLDRARALARSAPGDRDALLALAEAALAMREPGIAQNALKQRFAVAPDDPNAHTLLGRARRMAADAAGAEASFRRALELAPGHVDALAALAALLLDQGSYADADLAYQELATHGGGALVGRLGRVDALIGLTRIADAQVQLDAVAEPQRTSAAYRETAARLALARGKPGDALSFLRPLVEEQAKRASLQVLYGDALSAAQQLEAAAAAYEAALALDTDLPEALLGRAELQLATAKPNDVLATLARAQSALGSRIRPKALQARRLLLQGRALAQRNKRGDADAAREALHAASELPGAPADAFYFLAEALGGRSNPEAVTAYRRYLELEPRGRHAERVRRLLGSLR